MRTFVVGTAGHIDHGKSTLVRALTGTDPDRLAEEKLRGMTIDLGFAHLTSPAGRDIGIVDVPGHERFIKNMLAGVGGIDAALLVVAADEGPMPQTVEHLDILTLLGVDRAVVALTKADLVEPDWADYVAEEVRERIAGSTIASAEIVPVSAADRRGLGPLLDALDRALGDIPARRSSGFARLPIDRVFTMPGFGTVVTGTLLGGELAVGAEVEIVPAGRRARVRGLQSHGSRLDRTPAGRRVAVNLQGIDTDDLARGDVLALPSALRPTALIDVRVELLASAPISVERGSRVDVFAGSSEVAARVVPIAQEQIQPGASAWAQLHLDAPLAVLRGDRLVLRRSSPSSTIGGALVVDTQPRRHRASDKGVVARLETLSAGTPAEVLVAALGGDVVLRGDVPSRLTSLQKDEVEASLAESIEAGAVRVAGDHVVASRTWSDLGGWITEILEAFHRAEPFRRGMPREELRSRLKLPGGQAAFDAALALAAADGLAVADPQTVRRPTFEIVLAQADRRAADRFLAALDHSPFAPPSPGDSSLPPAVLTALIERGELVDVGGGIVYRPETLERIKRIVLDAIAERGKITLADYRDAVGTSRRYAQATLEYLDGLRVTRRVGDDRVRGR